jgi:glutamyl-tRNA synthetase
MEKEALVIKTRIAPSPTGDFHIGQMRTVLYDYAYAKQKGGVFLLRLEDTDRVRYVNGAEDRIMDTILDFGLPWDEGVRVGGEFGPYIQSQRLDVYRKYALELVEKGFAYYCFCTKERIDELRKKQQEAHLPTTKYDKQCMGLSTEQIKDNLRSGMAYTIRLNVPKDEIIKFKDEVLGDLEFPSNDLDDQVLLKSDGFPTYHLAVVVDDYLMKVTHVFRGVDWLPSTPKHVLLYRAFGWNLPVYAHLPNLKEVDEKQKMSKRRGSAFAYEFLKEGYLPEALVNFLMFLGWNPGGEREIYSLEGFVREFSLERVQKTDLVSFDRAKLLWMNGHYLRELSDDALYDKISDWAKKWDVNLSLELKDRMFAIRILALIKDRMKILSDFKELSTYFFADPMVDPKAFSIHSGERWQDILQGFKKVYAELEERLWTKENLDKVSYKVLEDFGYSPKEAFMTLRLAVTGQTATPPLFDVLELLGKDVVEHRLKVALPTNSN